MSGFLGDLYAENWPQRYRKKTRRSEMVGYGSGSSQARDSFVFMRRNEETGGFVVLRQSRAFDTTRPDEQR